MEIGRILIVGATSSLTQALCRTLAKRGHSLILAGRDGDELSLLAGDLQARFNVSCDTLAADLLAPGFSAQKLVERAGDFLHLIISIGDMGGETQDNTANIEYTAYVNYTAPAQIAAISAQKLAEKGAGTVVIISSVAGDRGRQSNYAYGAAKAALSTFASGLRNRYAKSGVHIMTVKPGFVDTPMTWGMTSPLIAGREYVANYIADAMEKKKDVIYAPFFWRYIMLIIRAIPERIFKKLSL